MTQEIVFNCPIERKLQRKGRFAADSVMRGAERRNAACQTGNTAGHSGHETRQRGNYRYQDGNDR